MQKFCLYRTPQLLICARVEARISLFVLMLRSEVQPRQTAGWHTACYLHKSAAMLQRLADGCEPTRS